MAVRRSWLRTRQSICSLLPCRQLPDHTREVFYRREMKMSEFWRSCSVSCGTSICGLLWNSGQWGLGPCMSYCTVSGRCQDGSLAVQLGIATWLTTALTVGGTGNTHRRLAHQRDRENPATGVANLGTTADSTSWFAGQGKRGYRYCALTPTTGILQRYEVWKFHFFAVRACGGALILQAHPLVAIANALSGDRL